MKSLWIAVILAVCPLWAPFRDFPPYKIYQGLLGEDNQPISGARLCANEEKSHCFALAHSRTGSDEDSWLYYGLRAKSQRLKLAGGGGVVLFNANSGGGSGSSDRYVLLRSEPDRQFKNLLPEIIVTNQADVAAWNLPTVSSMPVFLTADYLWGAMEGHYSSHFFEVRIYVYDPVADRYKLRHKYQTAHKYPGIDNWEQAPEVLDKERGRILEVLKAQ
ncbi:hypothetical protein [Acidicapsa ligni]|uniref:hypothetical protein n=1 Tax=Acidicapsa ligni TaxID=542300 RepID=UPI0021E02073|nr:hypothetical protein [Acidicapsa ligni]